MTEPRGRTSWRTPPFSTYVLAHLPGWTAVLIVAWILVTWIGVPFWVGLLLVGLMVVKDVVSYPTMRRYYTPEPPERRLVGRVGASVTTLAPRGLIRVGGELWQARVTSEGSLPEGSRVRVRGVEGLTLIVEIADAPGDG